MNYYCTDWITFLCNLIAIWLIGSGKKYGFIFGMVACTADFAFGYLAQSSAVMVSAILFTGFNIRAYYKWRKLKHGHNEQGWECIQAEQSQPDQEGAKTVE